MALYDEIGANYIRGQKSFRKGRAERGTNFIRSQFRPILGKTLLDLGCGSGWDMRVFLKVGACVTGVDESAYMVKEANRYLRRTVPNNFMADVSRGRTRWHVEQADFHNIPGDDSIYEGVYSRFALHYSNNIDAVYEEVYRKLKPKGVFAFVVPHPEHDLALNAQGDRTKKEISVPLYGGAVTVTYPTHTMKDYVSPTFDALFDLTAMESFHEEHVQQSGLPTGLCIAGVKR